MNEDFVPFELAVKLEEKGFDKETSHYYNGKGEICVSLVDEEYPYPCPTIPQVLKWLREEKKIYIVIGVNPTLTTKDRMAYYYQVYSNSNGVASDYYESEECYAQWEDCAIESIKSVLKYLI